MCLIRYAPILLALCHMPFVLGAELVLEDTLLRKAIEAYQIQPYAPEGNTFGSKERLGQALFFDPVVSGPKAIACGACHIRSKGSADGLPVAIGLGAKGVSSERLQHKTAFVVPRNAMPFFNRGSSDFKVLFWDGRLQMGQNNEIESPLAANLPRGFDSVLAAAAVFPPAEPDEMLGRPKNRAATQATYHGELVEVSVDSDNMQARTLNVFKNLVLRLVGVPGESVSPLQKEYQVLFQAAYPQKEIAELNVTDIGNALAAYIGFAFELKSAPWDDYVRGDTDALSISQKRGALLFFGKGRCVVCHNGEQFSDFGFHGLAIPQLEIGKHGAYQDYGRAGATSLPEDRFKFRTPPLRNVVQTGPWGHNGVFATLEGAIEHHINPVPLLYKAQMQFPNEAQNAGRLIAARSPLLAEIGQLTIDEIALLTEFLKSINSETVVSDELALPSRVPSGDNQFIRR